MKLYSIKSHDLAVCSVLSESHLYCCNLTVFFLIAVCVLIQIYHSLFILSTIDKYHLSNDEQPGEIKMFILFGDYFVLPSVCN